MSAWYKRRWLRVVLLSAIIVVVTLAALQWWLASEIGRGLVESRLSSALSRPVRLDGEFSIGIIPIPGASGTELRIFSPDGRWTVVDAGAWSVSLALGPLFGGEVELVSLRIADAAIDLGRLAAATVKTDRDDFSATAIPDIRNLGFEDVTLHFEGLGSDPHIRLTALTLEDFAVGEAAAFEVSAAVVSEAREQLSLTAVGTLTLSAKGEAQTRIGDLDIEAFDWTVAGLQGEAIVAPGSATLEISLSGSSVGETYGLTSRITWGHTFEDQQEGYLIERAAFSLDPHRIEGDGCYLNGEPPTLQLFLASESLDLERLRMLYEDWRPDEDPGLAQDGAGQADSEERSVQGTVDPLPVDLRVVLEIESASLGDASAEGVSLAVGSPPQCPDTP